jgi:DNA polymerase I-like protein with 3'-5' exonuclease and polymerase domains
LFLSQDKTGIEEWNAGIDQHTMNQEAFVLPSRLIAKKFLFRAIFLGSAYAYANDPEFQHVSSNQNYWEAVIERFYGKYKGFGKWVEATVKSVILNKGYYTSITGVQWYHQPQVRRGESEWPRTAIANYPIQHLEAEIMKLYRIHVYKRLVKEVPEAKLFSSVHDSLCVDTPEKYLYTVKCILDEEAAKMPQYLKLYYNIDFNIEFRVESCFGMNYYDLEEFK